MDAIILSSHNSFILYGYLENEYECDDPQKSGARIAVVRGRHGRRFRAGSAGMPFLRPRLAGKPGAGDHHRHPHPHAVPARPAFRRRHPHRRQAVAGNRRGAAGCVGQRGGDTRPGTGAAGRHRRRRRAGHRRQLRHRPLDGLAEQDGGADRLWQFDLRQLGHRGRGAGDRGRRPGCRGGDRLHRRAGRAGGAGLPLLAPLLSLSAVQYGIFAGLTVYAVPQVLAATSVVSLTSVHIGTLVKLVRVLMLGPVVLLLSLFGRKEGGSRPALAHVLPWFIVGFLLLMALRSFGLVPGWALHPAQASSSMLAIMSMAALGLGVDARLVLRAGARVTGVVVMSLLVLGAISLLLIRWLGVA